MTVPDGSYSKVELVNYLNTNMGAGITVTYSSNTSKVTINNTSGSAITLIANPISSSSYQSLGQILGFITPATINNGVSEEGSSAMLNPQEPYIFLKINDFGNIIHQNRRYVAKIIPDSQGRFDDLNQETIMKMITNNIKFDQPTDIPSLRLTLEDQYGNVIVNNDSEFSLTLELVVITNTILKNYDEIKFYNDKVMERLLMAKMFAYYEKQVDKDVNNTLTKNYNSSINNLKNQQEYTPFGSSNNYAPSFAYFTDMNKR